MGGTSKGIKVDHDEIIRIGTQLRHLYDELKIAADGAAQVQPIAESHFAQVKPNSDTAGKLAVNAEQQITTGIGQAAAVLLAFLNTLEGAVKTHKQNDEDAQQSLRNAGQGVN